MAFSAMRTQPGSGGVQRARALLLECLAQAADAPGPDAWPQALARAAGSRALELQWRGQLGEPPPVAAIRVAHALEMGTAGLQGWYAAWPDMPEGAPLQFAAAAAALLAGREPLLVLAAGLGGAAGGAGDACGALVDADSCARMTVAGLDPETELRLGNCAELLASAGDLLDRPAGAGAGAARFLILGLKCRAPAGD